MIKCLGATGWPHTPSVSTGHGSLSTWKGVISHYVSATCQEVSNVAAQPWPWPVTIWGGAQPTVWEADRTGLWGGLGRLALAPGDWSR